MPDEPNEPVNRSRPWHGRTVMVACVMVALCAPAAAQETRRLFPDRSLMPTLFAGPRDPVAKADLVLVTDNPNAFGKGVEAEVALGLSVPVLLLSGRARTDALVLGLEGSAFARFGLQLTEREMIGSDWTFAVPLVWHRGDHWLRLRYYHTSSHLGDEYARRFDVEGGNFARDALGALGYLQFSRIAGVYGGVRWAYNVHPEDSGRWTLRAGTQLGRAEGSRALLPYGSADLELEDDTDWIPLVHLQAGLWLPPIGERRAVRVGVGFLTGPSPLGQFRRGRTTQLTIGASGHL